MGCRNDPLNVVILERAVRPNHLRPIVLVATQVQSANYGESCTTTHEAVTMDEARFSRRNALGLAIGARLAAKMAGSSAQEARPDWLVAPIGRAGERPGDGFRIGHGFACENTWFAPGWWHTGEDWYAIDGDTAGASVLAIAGGEVVYADFDYPGRVVIVQHAIDLFSVYGHLVYDLAVQAGQRVSAGDELGIVLAQPNQRSAGQAPSHLHHEVRTFLTRDDVNGSSPRYGVNCGFQCPPGPGYWPISATELPSELGWRNPLLDRLDRAKLDGAMLIPQAAFLGQTVDVFRDPDTASESIGTITLDEDTVIPVSELSIGDPASTATSAEAYEMWFRVELEDGGQGWVRGANPSTRETGSDGRPSAVDLPFVISGVQ